MRFRRLTKEELRSLETEFKHFLVVNEVYDEEWRRLADNNPEKAEEYIVRFSDLVLEKVYSKVDYLVHFTRNLVSFFDMSSTVFISFQLKYKGTETIENEDSLRSLLQSSFEDFSFFKGEKKSKKEKCDEVYDLIRKGCEVCDKPYFLSFTEMINSQKI